MKCVDTRHYGWMVDCCLCSLPLLRNFCLSLNANGKKVLTSLCVQDLSLACRWTSPVIIMVMAIAHLHYKLCVHITSIFSCFCKIYIYASDQTHHPISLISKKQTTSKNKLVADKIFANRGDLKRNSSIGVVDFEDTILIKAGGTRVHALHSKLAMKRVIKSENKILKVGLLSTQNYFFVRLFCQVEIFITIFASNSKVSAWLLTYKCMYYLFNALYNSKKPIML